MQAGGLLELEKKREEGSSRSSRKGQPRSWTFNKPQSVSDVVNFPSPRTFSGIYISIGLAWRGNSSWSLTIPNYRYFLHATLTILNCRPSRLAKLDWRPWMQSKVSEEMTTEKFFDKSYVSQGVKNTSDFVEFIFRIRIPMTLLTRNIVELGN